MNDNLTDKLSVLARRHRAEMLAFCQRLVQTPSLSGEEGDVAALIRIEMERLSYDEVWAGDQPTPADTSDPPTSEGGAKGG